MSQHRISVKASQITAVEYDPEVGAWYLRFAEGKVAKTVAEKRGRGIIVAVDFDAQGRALGLEVVGGSLKSINLRKLCRQAKLNVDAPDMDVSTG